MAERIDPMFREARECLDAVLDSPDLSDWEADFAESVDTWWDKNHFWTPKQIDTIMNIYDKRCLHALTRAMVVR